MDPTSVKRMIHRLITDEETEVAPEPAEPDVDPGAGPDEDGSMGVVVESGAEAEAGQAEAVEARKSMISAVERVTQEAEAEAELIGERLAELPTEALRITEAELRFMDEVAPLMPRTPRSVKRFVNIYRLYKAALSTPALGSFLGTPERPGNFRAVQVLLALVTGTPEFAKAVVDALERTDGTDPADLASLVESDAFTAVRDDSWTTTLVALQEFAQGGNNLELDELRAVSPLVCRYSVHHMVSESPGESVLG